MTFSGEWNALCREASISGQLLNTGLSSLRKANYAMTGLYSQAFFSLSIGLERLLKLIILIDRKINSGEYPAESEFRTTFGHDINKLFGFAIKIHEKLPDKSKRYEFDSDGIEKDIIIFLSKFAKSTRYYNLDFLSNNRQDQYFDPIGEWYQKIGQQILDKHYSSKNKSTDYKFASNTQKCFEDFVLVRQTSEDGIFLNNLESSIIRSCENKIMQKYGTFYCVKISRFLYMILYDLIRKAHTLRLEIPYLDEMFFPFMNNDKYLLSLKTFPPRGQ